MSRSTTIAPARVRTINGRVTFRDTHLRFRKFPISDIGSDCLSHDACEYGTGILRVACRWITDAWYLCYQYIPTPNTLTNPLSNNWPAWVNTGVGLDPRSSVAAHNGYIYYRNANGAVFRAIFDGASLTYEYLFDAPNTPMAFAPITDDEVYLQWKVTDKTYTKIAHYAVSSDTTTEWPGRLYSQSAWLYGFDAVRLNGRDRIYLADERAKRELYITRAGAWSEVNQLIPLDVVDQTSSFILGGASVINNQVWLSGVLRRDENFPMHIYTREITEDHYSLDREMFIRSGQTREKLFGEEVYTVPSGKLILVGDILWYVSPGSVYYAYATNLCGYDRADYKLQTSGVASLNATFAANQPGSLNLDLATSIQNTLLSPGSEATLELGYDGEYAQMGKFDITLGSNGAEQSGTNQGILATSFACKRMNQWQPDANFDYWSQTKVGCRPSDMTKLVRVSGKYSGTTNLSLDKLNVDGFMYAVDRQSRNHTVRAKFSFPPDSSGYFHPVFGVVCQYYHSVDIGNNGIAGVYEDGKLYLRVLRGDVFTNLADYTVTFNSDTWYWIQIVFHDCDIKVQYRQDGSATWITAISDTFEEVDTPWVREDYVGRGALYLRNTTPHSDSYPFASADMVIPVKDNTVFPVSGTVIVDDEIITYSGKSHSVRQDDLIPALGDAIVGNTNEENLTGWTHFAHDDGGPQISAAIQTFYLPADYYISGVKAYIKKRAGMTNDLGIAIYQGPRSTKKPVGVKIASGTVDNDDLSETGSWVTASFGTPMFMGKANQYWIVFYQSDDPGDPHDPGFDIGNTTDLTAGQLFTFNEDEDTPSAAWDGTGGDALFSLIGSASANSWVIVLDNLTPPTDPAKFNDMALIGTAGTGLNEMFVVLGYGGATNSGNHIVFVDRNPEGVIGDDTKFVLAPTLKVVARGASNTTATYHSASICSLYIDLSVLCQYFNYYSHEVDMRIEDVIRELAAKAGITAYSDKRMPSSIVVGIDGSTPVVKAHEFILRFKALSDIGYSVPFRSAALVSGWPNDCMSLDISIVNNVVTLALKDLNAATTLETVAVAGLSSGWLTVSLFENHLAIWLDGYHVHAFDLGAFTTTQSGDIAALYSDTATTLEVDWSQCDQRRDNYIFDMGTTALGLLVELLKERRINYQDDENGCLRLYRDRKSVLNPDGVPYELSAMSSVNETDADFASRIRLVGAEIAEGYDRSALLEHGNIFQLIYSQVLNYEYEIMDEAARHIVDTVSSRDQYVLVGALDPRVEPGDVISTIVNGVKTEMIVVDTMAVSLNLDAASASMDMQLESHRYMPYDGSSDIVISSVSSPLNWADGLEDPTGSTRVMILYKNDGSVKTYPASYAGFIDATGHLGYNDVLYVPPIDITSEALNSIIIPPGATLVGAGKDSTIFRGGFYFVLGLGASLRDVQIISDVGKSFSESDFYYYLVFGAASCTIQNCTIVLTKSNAHAVAFFNRGGNAVLKNVDLSVKTTGIVNNDEDIPAEAACIANVTKYSQASVAVFGGELVSSDLVLATQLHPPISTITETVSPQYVAITGAIKKENV